MTRRNLYSSVLLGIALSLSVSCLLIAQTPSKKPDLQGTWTFATLTPMERPVNLGDKEFYGLAGALRGARAEEEAAQKKK